MPDLAAIVNRISDYKGEPEWMRRLRLKALEAFLAKPLPKWGPSLSEIDFSAINYFSPLTKTPKKRWEDVPENIKAFFVKLGIPEAEQKFLAGVELQYESSVVYGSLKKRLAEQGVIFMDTDSALKEHEELFKEYFGKLVPYTDNKFAALNTAFWSGGSFIYVPPGVKVSMPMHAFFRMESPYMGQFERTLIIIDEGAEAEYLEGCTAPMQITYSLHAAVVEVYVKKGAKFKYSTMQNWSHNVYNLVTKRAKVEQGAKMQWVDVNVGSKVTMKYPSCILAGPYASGAIFSLSVADKGQDQDTGTKMIHLAPNTRSLVVTKAIGKRGGVNEYRGLIDIGTKAKNSVSNVSCDALLLDNESYAGTKPVNRVRNMQSKIYHEASISQLDDLKTYFLQARGLSPFEAKMAVVSGFVEEVARRLPLEFALEFDKLLEFLFSDEED